MSANLFRTLPRAVQGAFWLIIKLVCIIEYGNLRGVHKTLLSKSLVVLNVELFVEVLVCLQIVGHLLAILQRRITSAITLVDPVLSHNAHEVDLKGDETASDHDSRSNKVRRAVYYVAKGAFLHTFFGAESAFIDINL